MLEIECVGERLQLLPEKAIFWKRTSTLVVADLHFGKPAAFRQSGIAVPENTTAEDLARLETILDRTRSKRLVILGDFFHASAGLQPEMLNAVEAWRKNRLQLSILLVRGNHDKRAGNPPESWGIEIVSGGEQDGPFALCHEPEESSAGYVLCGHIHPAIALGEKFGRGIRAPCFCFGERCAILPAFGSFTGMRNIHLRNGDRIFAVGSDEIIEVTGHFSSSRKARAP